MGVPIFQNHLAKKKNAFLLYLLVHIVVRSVVTIFILDLVLFMCLLSNHFFRLFLEYMMFFFYVPSQPWVSLCWNTSKILVLFEFNILFFSLFNVFSNYLMFFFLLLLKEVFFCTFYSLRYETIYFSEQIVRQLFLILNEN